MAKPSSRPIEYKLDPSQWVEWEYERPEGNITVYAPTKAEAIRTMAENGFSGLNAKKLKRRDHLLTDLLKKDAL
jgi:hypothetical protein